MKIQQFLPLPQFTFVWIFSGFTLGIIFSPIGNSWVFPATVLAFPFLILLFKSPIRAVWLAQISLLFIWMFIGMDYTNERSPAKNELKWKNYYKTGRHFDAEIIDISVNEKEWKKCILQVKNIFTEKTKVPQDIQLLAYVKAGINDFERGDFLRLNVEVFPIKNNGNPGEFDAKYYWKTRNIHQMCFFDKKDAVFLKSESSFIQNWMVWVDRKLSEKLAMEFDGVEVGVLKALVLGDKDDLDSEIMQSFSSAGAMHVLAVSGIHVGIVLNIFLYLFGRIPKYISKYQALVISLAIILFYAAITGFSPSVCRAVLMFGLLAISKLLQKQYQPLNVLFFSALLLLLFEPNYLYDIGFQLSYLAMVGIFLFYDKLSKLVYFDSKLLMKLMQATALGIAATLTTFPLTLFYFHQFPNYFALSNLLLLFTADGVLILGIAFLSLGVLPGVKVILSWLLWLGAMLMIISVRWVENLPWSVAYGFELNWWLVGLLFLGILTAYGLITLQIKRAFLYIFFITGFLLGMVQSTRFKNMRTNEIVVFASKDLVIAAKIEDQIVVFYNGVLKKAQLAVKGYQQLKSGTVSWVSLVKKNRHEIKSEHVNFEIASSKEYMRIRVNEKKWIVLLEPSTYVRAEKSDQFIFPSWIKKQKLKGHYLEKGALTIPIEAI